MLLMETMQNRFRKVAEQLRVFSSIWKVTSIVLLIIGVVFSWSIYTDREKVLSDEFQALEGQSKLASSQVSGVLRGLDVGLSGLVADQTANPRISAPVITQRQLAFLKIFPEVKSVVVVDHQGRITSAESISDPQDLGTLRGFDVSKRDYFAFHRNATAADYDRFYVARPFKSILNRQLIAVSRAIRGRNGELQRVVAITLAADVFDPVLREILTNVVVDAAAIHNRFGDIIYRVPNPDTYFGKNIGSGAAFQQYLRSKNEITRYQGITVTDNVKRILVFQKIGDSTLDVGVSGQYDAIMAKWYRLAAMKLVLFAVIFLLSIALARQLVKQKEAKDEVIRNEERLTLAELVAKFGHWELNLNDQTVSASIGACRIYGVDKGHYDLPIVQNACLGKYRPMLDSALKALIEQNDPYDVSYKIKAQDNGQLKDIHSIAFFDSAKRVVFGVIQDITEQLKSEEDLRMAATVFSHAREGILITDANGYILNVNQTFTELTGYGRDEVIGLRSSVLQSGRHDTLFYEEIWRNVAENCYWQGEIWNRKKNGDVFPALLTISAVLDSQGNAQQYVGLFTDITEVKEHERKLEFMAHYDSLTQLPNRSLLSDRLQQAMAMALRRQLSFSLCYLDLDGFKQVNDTHGHEIGDQLLIALAERMKLALRKSDTLARIGGDEFVAILLDQADKDSFLMTAERLVETVSQPVFINGLEIRVSASLGIAFFPQDASVDVDQLLRQADHAMYQAKLSGKNRFCVFSKE